MLKEFDEYYNWCLSNKTKKSVVDKMLVLINENEQILSDLKELKEFNLNSVWVLNNNTQSESKFNVIVSCFNPTLKAITKDLFSLLNIETTFKTDNLRNDLPICVYM